MTDHADTIRYLTAERDRAIDAQHYAEGHADRFKQELADAQQAMREAAAALRKVTAERQQAIDLNDEARCEQAIDALRDTAARLDALADEGLYAVDPVLDAVHAALVRIGEQP